MAGSRISRAGWLAISLAVIGSVVALAREFVLYRRTGAVDWGHIAIAIAVPVFMWAVVGSRRRDGPA
jgi:hypothetical protein